MSTRALSLRAALILAGVMNLIAALPSTGVAVTVAKGLIDPPKGSAALSVVFAALVGAVAWNLVTWYFGLPSSSSHALVGGLVGAALASAGTVRWGGVVEKVLIPMVLSPAVGLILGYLAMVAVLWLLRRRNQHRVGHVFRRPADHAHPGAAGVPARPPARVRRRGGRLVGAVSHRVRVQGPGLHDPRHHPGATRRLSAVRWGVARDIVLGWVLTFPAAAAVAALAYWITRLVTG